MKGKMIKMGDVDGTLDFIGFDFDAGQNRQIHDRGKSLGPIQKSIIRGPSQRGPMKKKNSHGMFSNFAFLFCKFLGIFSKKILIVSS